jgi:hypothetical protein
MPISTRSPLARAVPPTSPKEGVSDMPYPIY